MSSQKISKIGCKNCFHV